MTFFGRFEGVLFSPRETFKSLSERPLWMDAFIILLVFTTIFTLLISPYLQKDRLETLKNSIELKERLGEQRYRQQLEFLENPPRWYSVLMFVSPLFMNLVGFFFPPLILLAMGRFFSTEGSR